MPISDPSTLPGPLALWKFDEGSGQIVKNHFAGTINPGVNLLPAPEQCFANATYWTSQPGTVTVTEGAANNHLGQPTATRLQIAPSGWFITTAGELGLPAGQYTVSAWLKSNDGGNHPMAIGFHSTVELGPSTNNITVTNASGWARYTFTATVTGTITVAYLYLPNNGADILCGGFQLEAGPTASAYHVPDLDLSLAAGAAGPSWGTGGVQSTGVQLGIATAPAYETFTEISAYGAIKVGSAAQYHFSLSERSDVSALSVAGGGTVATDRSGGRVAGTDYSGDANLRDGNWHVVALTWDGTTGRYYVDGTLVVTFAASSGWTSTGFILGNVSSLGLIGLRGVHAVYTEKHTDAEVRDMTDWIQTEMATRPITVPDLEVFVGFEGDSIMAGTSGFTPWPRTAMESLSSVYQWVNTAVGGQSLDPDGLGRATLMDGYASPDKTNPICVMAHGINDLGTITAAAYAVKVEDYFLDRRSAGLINVACTLTPSDRSAGALQVKIDEYNTWLRANYTDFADFLIDFAADAEIGPAAAAADTDLYYDGTHPTEYTLGVMAAIAEPVLELAIAMEPEINPALLVGRRIWSLN